MAEGFHCIIVLQTHFCDWRWAWKRRESLYVHHERVEGLARRMVLRRAFIHWKHCILCTTQPCLYSKNSKSSPACKTGVRRYMGRDRKSVV